MWFAFSQQLCYFIKYTTKFLLWEVGWRCNPVVREIMRDERFLSQTAELATPEDLPLAQDLQDTQTAHRDG